MKQLRELDITGKRVFVRGDLDVPIETQNANGLTTNAEVATRLTNLKPAIDYLLQNGARQVIIAGHIDRPSVAKALEGKPKFYDSIKSTKKLLVPLEKILGEEIKFEDALDFTSDAKIILFENLRFWDGETKNEGDFAKKLALLADIYINEAFGNCHREHASMVALPKLLPNAAGHHLVQEIEVMTKILESPEKPMVAIVGGAKIETKIPVIENLANIAHFVLVGGELPVEIEKKKMKFSENVFVAGLKDNNCEIDGVSLEHFQKVIEGANSVVWNGPLGLFEDGHIRSTLAVAETIIESGVYSIVGGGDTTQFLADSNLLSRFSFVSAGGGAMLEFLSGKKLPALEALE